MITQGETRTLLPRFTEIINMTGQNKLDQLLDFVDDLKASYDYETSKGYVIFHDPIIHDFYEEAYRQCCIAQKKSTA